MENQPGTVDSASLIHLKPRALISSAVMMVTIAGASWTVVVPLAAEVTMLARSMSRSPSRAISGSPLLARGDAGATGSGSATSCAQADPHRTADRTMANSRLISLLHDDEFDPAVLRASLGGPARIDWPGVAVADRLEPLGLDASSHQVVADCLRARLRQLLVLARRARFVGMPLDADPL